MKTTITWLAVLALGLTAVPAAAQEMDAQHETMSPMAGMCRMMQSMQAQHGGEMGAKMGGQMMGGQMMGGGMMGGGMMGGMVNPGSLLAAKDILGLSADQVARLEELAKQSPMGGMQSMQGHEGMMSQHGREGAGMKQGAGMKEGMKMQEGMMQQHMAARKAALEVLTDEQRAQLETSMKLMHTMMGAMCKGMGEMQHAPNR